MDAGIFRRNVAEESQITNVELKYMPVWTVPVTCRGRWMGQYRGGYQANARQMSDSYKKKDAKGFFSSLGKMAAKTALSARRPCRRPAEAEPSPPGKFAVYAVRKIPACSLGRGPGVGCHTGVSVGESHGSVLARQVLGLTIRFVLIVRQARLALNGPAITGP